MAGRPRLPQEVAKITGAVAKNAGRFKNRADPKVKSLGPAPKSFSEARAAVWDQFNADYPWLGRSDRGIVKMAVLLDEQVEAADAPMAVFAQYRMVLASMGGTPVDRSKVNAPDDDDKDPADEFLN